MPDTTCTKVLRFSAGHRLLNHEGQCAQLHGHNYRAEITAATLSWHLDAIGRVVDFSVLKAKLGAWIDREWDHAFIVNLDDEHAIHALHLFTQLSGLTQRIAYLDRNPTAENMARQLFHVGNELLHPDGVQVVRVRLWETATCFAEVTA
jgi:6-pyruvoyltetrahydropterin/6-carboxytetrahydropterin synthase